MRTSRNRHYGHPQLVKFVQDLGQQVDELGIGTLLVGDLSQPRGGPMSSMHRSHQSGLDVDLWFWLPRNIAVRSLSATEREQWHAPSMLATDGDSLHPVNWTAAQDELLRLVARHPAVDRVFVHAVIKRELCHRWAGSQWLRKLRPWWGHQHHLHARLRCPPGETRCVSQQPLPSGDGCDESLAWWFSEEAKQRPAKPSTVFDLPAACLALINES
jgi:penicillin-insensitive murein endopeptidase